MFAQQTLQRLPIEKPSVHDEAIAVVEGSVESSVLPVLVSAMERLGEEAAKAADKQVAEMRTTFETAQSKLARERDEAVSAAHDIRIELTARADQVKDLRETIKAQRTEIAEQRTRLDRSETARRKLDDRTHTLSAEATHLSEARDRLEKTVAEKSDALAQASADRDTLHAEIATLAATNTDLAAQLTLRTEAVETRQSLIDELHDAQQVLDQQIAETAQRQVASEATATATIAGLEARLADRERTIKALIEKIGD